MTALYDRRRVNGPEETFLPLFNLEVSGESRENVPKWAMNEQRLLINPSQGNPDELERTMMTIGHDNLSVARIARHDFSERQDNRRDFDSRPMCMY